MVRSVAILSLIVFLVPASLVQADDLDAETILIAIAQAQPASPQTASGATLYDVTPVMNLQIAGGNLLIEYDVLVNGGLVGTDTIAVGDSSFVFYCGAGPPCAADPCDVGDGLTGVCDPLNCGCRISDVELDALTVSLNPGDIVEVVLDPNDLIPETDETNNAAQVTFTAIPTVSEWGLIALAGLLIIAGVSAIWVGKARRTSTA